MWVLIDAWPQWRKPGFVPSPALNRHCHPKQNFFSVGVWGAGGQAGGTGGGGDRGT